MPLTFDDYLQQGSSADTSAGEGEQSWWRRNKGAVTAAALGGASLVARRPIGALLARAPVAAQLGRGVQGVFNPTSLPDAGLQPGAKPFQFATPEATTAREAESLIRSAFGRSARLSDQQFSKLEPHWARINALSDIDKSDFIHYVETRSAGGRIPHPELQPAADALREVYKQTESEMKSLRRFQGSKSSPPMQFVEDYYRHLYKPKGNEDIDRLAFRRIGEGSFTKGRVLPTIRDAIAAGYEPITNDPIEMTTRYIQNANRFIARERVLEQAQNANLLIKTNRLAAKPPAGWVELFSRGTQRYYAPAGFARIWRNFTSPGFTGPMGDVYRPMQHAFNAITWLELGLSGFHATTMANEGIVNEVANAVQHGARGHLTDALKALVRAPGAPVGLYRRGLEVEKSWLGSTPGTHQMRRVVDLLERAGGRAKVFMRPDEYRASAAGSYFEAWKRGALRMQADEAWKTAKSGPLGPAKVAWSSVSRAMDTISAPLFEKYIPRMKNGAFYETMAQWLQHNPGASVAEQERAARAIWDSIDNRFGELVQDNIFWDRTLKQSSMLMLRSYSWLLGTLREIGGGVGDLTRGELSQRASYVIALPIVYGAVNALYQALKTGQPPQDYHDLIAPRTGGVDAATGQPERLAPIGYMRDVFSWTEDPVRTATAKIATGPRLTGELLTGKDWRGDPIAGPDMSGLEHVAAYAKHVGEAFTPLSIRNAWKRKTGSAVSGAENLFGLQAAGRGYVDPEGLASMQENIAKKAWRRKTQYEAKQQSYYDEATD